MVCSGVPFYSGNCFDEVVILFISRICACECSVRVNCPWRIFVSANVSLFLFYFLFFFYLQVCIMCVCLCGCLCPYMCVYTFGFFVLLLYYSSSSSAIMFSWQLIFLPEWLRVWRVCFFFSFITLFPSIIYESWYAIKFNWLLIFLAVWYF